MTIRTWTAWYIKVDGLDLQVVEKGGRRRVDQTRIGHMLCPQTHEKIEDGIQSVTTIKTVLLS